MADTVTSTSSSAPWSVQIPYLTQIFDEAQKQYASTTPQYYPGQVTAAMDPATIQAQDLLMRNAVGPKPGTQGVWPGVNPAVTPGTGPFGLPPSAWNYVSSGPVGMGGGGGTGMAAVNPNYTGGAPVSGLNPMFDPNDPQWTVMQGGGGMAPSGPYAPDMQSPYPTIPGGGGPMMPPAQGTHMQGQADTAAGTNQFLQRAMDVNNNPYLASAIQAAINPAIQQFYAPGGAMANIRGGAGDAGQYGGSRQGIAEGIATRGLTQGILNTSSTMASNAYNKGLDTATAATQMAPTIMGMQTAAPTALDAVGQQRQEYQQKLIDDQIAKWNWEQNLPAEKLNTYRSMITGGYGGSATSSVPMASSNPWMSGAGGAMTGYSLGGIPGAVIGGGLGYLLGR